MTLSISFLRPMTGSSLPSRAAAVRLRPNWSRMALPEGVPSLEGPPALTVSLPS